MHKEVPPFGRIKEVNRLINSIPKGLSFAIISAFGEERTSILNYLCNPKLYGDKGEKLIFSYVDVTTFSTDISQAGFWRKALTPLENMVGMSPELAKAYDTCQKGQFEHLDTLFRKMGEEGWQFVLMIDRFHRVLEYVGLSRQEFFGRLRSLSSALPSLGLIITLKISLNQFNRDVEKTVAYGHHGSPLNNPEEITLGVLEEVEIKTFFKQTPYYHFIEAERQFVKECAGGHPYLLEKSATILAEIYDNHKVFKSRMFRWLLSKMLPSAYGSFFEKAKTAVLERLERKITGVWESWPTNICEAFIAVAKMPGKVANYTRELEDLQRQGLVRLEETNKQWQIRSRVFSNLVANKTAQEFCEKSLNSTT